MAGKTRIAFVKWRDACGAQGYVVESDIEPIKSKSAGVLIERTRGRNGHITLALIDHEGGRDWLCIPNRMVDKVKVIKC